MLKQIRKRIIFSNMMIVTFILLFIGIYIITNTYLDLQNIVKSNLRQSIGYSESYKPPYIGRPNNDKQIDTNDLANILTSEKEIKYLTRSILAVKYDKESGTITKIIESASMKDETLKEAVEQVNKRDTEFGMLHGLGLYYYKNVDDKNVTISFADLSQTQSYIILMSLRYFLIGVVALIILTLFSFLLSLIAIRPIKKTWEQEQRFVADVSHELKTPITVILANSSIIKTHPNDKVSEQMKWIENTEEEAQHMKKLISSMLNLASLESGKLNSSFENINFGNIIEKCILQFEASAFEKGIIFTSEIAPDVIVSGSETQLKQLSIILIDNAVKYSPANNSIDIKLYKKHYSAMFSVHTNSVISQDDIPHLFERFFRTDKSRTNESENRGSYGLGLPIAKNIVNNHNGKIMVDSNTKDGTTFTVSVKCK